MKNINYIMACLVFSIALLLVSCSESQPSQSDSDLLDFNKYWDDDEELQALCEKSDITCIQNYIAEKNYVEFTTNEIHFDVVVRDFRADHPDFERFNKLTESSVCYTDAQIVTQESIDWLCEISDGTICRQDLLNTQVKYGATNLDSDIMGGMYLEHHIPNNKSYTYIWNSPVFTTRGMVEPYLVYESYLPLEATPIKTSPILCDNGYFHHWFTTDPNVSKETRSALTLKKDPLSDPENSIFYINSDESSCSGETCNYNDGGFFPLDKYDDPTSLDYSPGATWGKQTYRKWCPPGGADGTSNDPDCQVMRGGVDPVSGTPIGFNASHPLARNYHYTMVGYTQFTYNAGKKMKFMMSGNDDIWIFVDGVLAADLGGVHDPAEAIVNIDALALANGWDSPSRHDLHFFYTNRQTVESNLKIYTNISDVVDASFAPPRIKYARVNAKVSNEFTMYSNTKLSNQTIDLINAQAWSDGVAFADDLYKGPIYLESKSGSESSDYEEKNLVVTGISFDRNVGRDGYSYIVSIDDKCVESEECVIPSVGDSIAFRQSFKDAACPGCPKIISENGVATDEERVKSSVY